MNVLTINSSTSVTANTEAWCDTTSNSFILTFPSSPSNGNFIRVIDAKRNFQVNAVTINVGSKHINGSGTVALTLPGSTYEFTYIAANNEWTMFFNDVFSPYQVQAVTTGSNITGSIANNTLTLGLTGVVSGSVSGLTDGQFLVAEGSNWTNKTLTSTDLSVVDAPTSVTLNVNKGNLTEATSSVLTITNGSNSTLKNTSIQVKQANGSTSGYLSSTDWTTFNNKISSVTTSSPALTASGNAIDIPNQSANTVLAGPVSGGAAAPTFRALTSNDFTSSIFSGSFSAGMIPIYNAANLIGTTALTWASSTLSVVGSIFASNLRLLDTTSSPVVGVATLRGSGRVVVLTNAVTTGSYIFTNYVTKSGISNATLNIQNIVNGTSFQIQSSSNLDRSTVNWVIINP